MKRLFLVAVFFFSIQNHGFCASDFRGKIINTTGPVPKRVVCLMPNIAEIVEQLGKAETLVGITEYTRLKHAPTRPPKTLGPYNQLSAEVIATLKPDLILANVDGNDRALVLQLEKLNLNVTTIDTSSLASIVKSFELIALVLKAPNAPALKKFKNTLSRFSKVTHAHPQKVFLQVGWDPIVSISKSTFIHELVELAGGTNIFATSKIKYPRPNAEEVISANPDVILICNLSKDGIEAERSLMFWKQFKKMSAVRNDRIFIISGDLLTKPTLTLGVGLEKLQETIL